jgi:hypothetical protein
MVSDMKNSSPSSLLRSEVAEMIRDEYSGDRNPRPDILAGTIIRLVRGQSSQGGKHGTD